MDDIDQHEQVECGICGETHMVRDLIGAEVSNGLIVVHHMGFIGDCPDCDSSIFIENVG